ncbi:MAG: hypothetical protein U0350_28395 [Caldilineaceae bacterium]
MTITLPDELANQLQKTAEAQQLSVEETAALILRSALQNEHFFPTLEQVVAKIKATPPNPLSIRPAQGSLADALRNAPHDPEFNLANWTRQWEAVEAEIRAMASASDTHVDDE